MKKTRKKRNRITRCSISATCPIQRLKEIITQGEPVKAVLYMRESTYRQQKEGNLENRLAALRKAIRKRDIQVLDEFTEVISGRNLDDRPGLVKAINATREFQKRFPDDAIVLVTDARNRFIRGRYFNGQASTDNIHPSQWAALTKMAKGVRLVTVMSPNRSFSKVRGYETKLAGRAGKQLGRPKGSRKQKPCKPGAMIRRRERFLPQVRQLYASGESQRSIAKQLKLSTSTICDWLKSGK